MDKHLGFKKKDRWHFKGNGTVKDSKWTRELLKTLDTILTRSYSRDLTIHIPFCDTEITVEKSIVSTSVTKEEQLLDFPKFFDILKNKIKRFVELNVLR